MLFAAKHPLGRHVGSAHHDRVQSHKQLWSSYKHAARHLLECSSLSSGIEDFGAFQPHDAYEDRLKRKHVRKQSFWNLVR